MRLPDTLAAMGWDDRWTAAWAPQAAAGRAPGRVVCEVGGGYDVWTETGPLVAWTTGKFQHENPSRENRPAVGDWVAVTCRSDGQGDLHAVLPRRTRFMRRAAGERLVGQVVAANIDTVFLVTALDGNFNLRRIERTLAVAHASGAQPVVVLNKADLHRDPLSVRRGVELIAGGAPVVVVSALAGARKRRPRGAARAQTRVAAAPDLLPPAEALAPWLRPARTVAFLGSSGVGKSTLVNALAGEELLDTQETRAADDKGRHTTTRRELVITPAGVLVIDTPGMREMGLWGAGEMLATVFPEIAALATQCRFRDCRHEREPGCAVRAALERGELAPERFASFARLREDDAAAIAARKPRGAEVRTQHRYRALRQRFAQETGTEGSDD